MPSARGYRGAMSEIRATTWDDLGAVVALCSPETKPEHVRQRWNLTGYDVGWVAVADEGLVGHAALDGTQEATVLLRDPEAGDALIALVVGRARERGFDHVAITTAADDGLVTALLDRTGFALDREILRMWKALDGEFPAPSWPPGFTVRSYAPADGKAVQALLDQEYSGWDRDHVARTHDAWLAFMTDHDDFDPALWFLVERDGAVVGCALHWKESDDHGWVKDIVVHESERGRGLGKALLQQGFRAYAERGVRRVGLKVDSTNPTGAPQLYERVGFVTDQRLGIWTKRL